MKIHTTVDNLPYYKKFLQIEESVNYFLKNNGYLKIDLPVLLPALIPESYLEIFETKFMFLNKNENLYLTPSPELLLKRLLSANIGDCYYLGKSFRNSDPSAPLHSFEFTMLELYKMGANYMDIADIVLEMLRFISYRVNKNKLEITYQGKKISLIKWERLTVAQAFKKYAQINETELFNHKLFIKKAKAKNYRVDGFTYEDLWSQIYTSEVEPHLGNHGYPTLIYDYPKEFAALAKLNKDGLTTQRFEFYIAGIELGDCYTELTDWIEQDKRFKIEEKKRIKDGKIIHPIDRGFIDTLKKGLDDCAGIAIGFERLAIIFADVKSIDKLKLINTY